jgi:hypothetical protein
MPTDTAFALGVLALVGRRRPPRLRAFVLTVAIADMRASSASISTASGTTYARAHGPRVAEDVDSADASRVTGTPSFFVNGRRHDGAYDVEALSNLVRETLDSGPDRAGPRCSRAVALAAGRDGTRGSSGRRAARRCGGIPSRPSNTVLLAGAPPVPSRTCRSLPSCSGSLPFELPSAVLVRRRRFLPSRGS